MQFEAHAVSRASRSNPLRRVEAERRRSGRIAKGDPHRPTGLEECAGLGRLRTELRRPGVLVARGSERAARLAGTGGVWSLLGGIHAAGRSVGIDPNAFLSNGLPTLTALGSTAGVDGTAVATR